MISQVDEIDFQVLLNKEYKTLSHWPLGMVFLTKKKTKTILSETLQNVQVILNDFFYAWSLLMCRCTYMCIFCEAQPKISSLFSFFEVLTYPYTPILHNISLKTVLYFCKWTVLKVLCYQNIYAEKHERNIHMHIFIGDNHGEWNNVKVSLG